MAVAIRLAHRPRPRATLNINDRRYAKFLHTPLPTRHFTLYFFVRHFGKKYTLTTPNTSPKPQHPLVLTIFREHDGNGVSLDGGVQEEDVLLVDAQAFLVLVEPLLLRFG